LRGRRGRVALVMLIAAAGVLLAAVVASGGSERESEHKGATEHEVYAPEGGEEHEGQLAPVSAQDRPQPVTPELTSGRDPDLRHDSSTNALIRRYRRLRLPS